MFVRLLIALLVLSGSLATAEPQQQPTFVLTVKASKPAVHASITDALKQLELVLKPKLLDKTKAHPASRMTLKLKLQVSPKAALRANAIDVEYRDGKGPITDDTIKAVVTDSLAKAKPLPKPQVGATVDVTISILQP